MHRSDVSSPQKRSRSIIFPVVSTLPTKLHHHVHKVHAFIYSTSSSCLHRGGAGPLSTYLQPGQGDILQVEERSQPELSHPEKTMEAPSRKA